MYSKPLWERVAVPQCTVPPPPRSLSRSEQESPSGKPPEDEENFTLLEPVQFTTLSDDVHYVYGDPLPPQPQASTSSTPIDRLFDDEDTESSFVVPEIPDDDVPSVVPHTEPEADVPSVVPDTEPGDLSLDRPAETFETSSESGSEADMPDEEDEDNYQQNLTVRQNFSDDDTEAVEDDPPERFQQVDDIPDNDEFPDRPMMNYQFDEALPADTRNGWNVTHNYFGEDDFEPEVIDIRAEDEPLDGLRIPFADTSMTTISRRHRQPIDFFNALFDEMFWTRMVVETNAYAQRRIEAELWDMPGADPDAPDGGATPDPSDAPDGDATADPLHPHARLKAWQPVDEAEMKKFVAYLILFGIVRLPDLEHYWRKTGAAQTPFFGEYMGRNRFTAILRNFHVADDRLNPPYKQEGHKPLAKIEPFMEMIRRNFKSVYKPRRDVSLDEGCCPWKGRLRFKQFNPRKPNRFHIKLFQIAEAKSGYLVDFAVYTGKGSCWRPNMTSCDAAHTETTKTVMTLAHDAGILWKGHHLYFDNWFSSPALMKELLMKDTYACGTTRANRQGMPAAFQERRPVAQRLQPGECQWRRQGELLALKWREKKEGKKEVHMLSTIHSAEYTYFGKKDRRTGEPIFKPKAVVHYTRKMGGVDRSDQLMTYYHFLRKSSKWWRKLWVHMLNMVVMNAYILYTKFGSGKIMSHNDYREVIALTLMGKVKEAHAYNPRKLPPQPVQIRGHWPEKYENRKDASRPRANRCKFCYRSKRADPEGKGKRKDTM